MVAIAKYVSKNICGNKKNSHTSNNNCSDVIVALGWGWAVESKIKAVAAARNPAGSGIVAMMALDRRDCCT